MKYLYLLLFLSFSVSADEFDWHSGDVSKSEVIFPSESGDVFIVLGSYCYVGGDTCDMSAKFSTSKKQDIEFLRLMGGSDAHLSVVNNRVEISIVYYPVGSYDSVKVSRYYEWDAQAQMLELKDTTEQTTEI